MNLKKILIIGNVVLIILATIWVFDEKNSLEPKLAVGGLFLTLVAQIWNVNNGNNETKPPSMKQKGGKKSKQYQAGGNINIGKK